MKKFFLLAMAAVALTFNSCKNEPAPAPEEPQAEEIQVIETDSIAKVLEAADSTQLGSLLTTVQEQIETLKGTDPAKAKEYLTKVQEFLKENADKIKSVVGTGTIATLVDQVANFELPDVADAAVEGAENAAGEAVDAAKDKAEEVKDAAVDKANEAVDAAKDKAEEIKDAATDKANEAVDAAKEKAAGAVDAAADKLKGALK